MTPEAQRIAIAEACGWRQAPSTKQFRPGEATARKQYHPWKVEETIPDYTTSLDAIAEAERLITQPTQTRQYERALFDVLERDHSDTLGVSGYDYATATAAQRAEAFLRTLNLWKDETSGVPKP